MINIRLSKLIDLKKISNKKIVFIGLDGGSKRIIDYLISQNKLPAISSLIRKGSYFSSHSDIVGSSAVLWTSVASAKNPEKHGIRSFYGQPKDLKSKRIWEIFNELGFPVGVFGYFITWPPSKVNGFMIPDLLSLDNRCYPEKYSFMWDITRIEKLKKSVSTLEMVGYFVKSLTKGVRIPTLLKAGTEIIKRKLYHEDKMNSYFSTRTIKTKFHTDLFIKLNREYIPKYSSLHIHLVDGASHRFWKYMKPELYPDVSKDEIRRYGSKVYDAYDYADKMIQKIIDSVDSDTLIVVASDHGFKAPVKSIHWTDSVTLNVEKFSTLFDDQYRRDLGFTLLIPKIHLNIQNNTPKKYEYCKTLIESIEVSEDNKPLFKVADVDNENMIINFNGNIDEISGKHISLNGEVLNVVDYLNFNHAYTSGVHDKKDGILIISGPDVKQNNQSKQIVTLVDIIPTILALCNLPVGMDMDGKVITDAIIEEFLDAFPVQYIDTYENPDLKANNEKKESRLTDEETEDLKNQLKNLGYL